MRARLTKSIVDALENAPGKHTAWDGLIPGFGVRITSKGKRVYYLKYRTKDGLSRKPAIGVHGAITCDQAREIAREWAHRVAQGGDPSADRSASRAGLTIADLCDRYVRDYAGLRKRNTTNEEGNALIRRFIKPRLGKKRIASLSRKDVSDLHVAMAATPYQANRALALISHMMTVAIRWGLRSDETNPCRGIERYKETPRQRYLSPEELERLQAVLDAKYAADPLRSAYVRLLLLTGARRSELLTLQWSFVDLAAKRIRLPHSKTGAKTIILSDAAAHTLAGVPRLQGSPFVFWGDRPQQKTIAVDKFWNNVRAEADLAGFRLHDLRHSFASLAANNGVDIAMIGGLLGHKSVATTSRYAHLFETSLRDAAERVSRAVKSD